MKPSVFIGSSLEGKEICDAIHVGLQHDATVIPWYTSFGMSSVTLDSLLTEFSTKHFGIFVFSPDDPISQRDSKYIVARDNVIFEAGLFMGMHGRKQTFIVVPRSVKNFHLPSDFLGLTTASYDPAALSVNSAAALAPVVAEIRKAMHAEAQQRKNVFIKSFVSFKSDAAYPLKLNITLRNNGSETVMVESLDFLPAEDASVAPNKPMLGEKAHKPFFKVGSVETPDGLKDKYQKVCVLAPGEDVTTWMPFDPSIGENLLDELCQKMRVGTWRYRCIWDGNPPQAYGYEHKF